MKFVLGLVARRSGVEVAARFGPFAVSLGHGGDIREAERVEKVSHVGARRSPDGEQHTLPLVVAGPVGVGLSEVSGGDGPVDSANDVGQFDVGWRTRENVTAAHAPFGADDAGTLEGQQDLFEIWLGKSRAFGDLAHRGWCALGVEGQRQQSSRRIVSSGRHPHGRILTTVPSFPRH